MNKKVIEENTIFNNGGTNLHINIFAQGCHEDNPTKFLQEPHGKPNPPKNRVLYKIHMSTMGSIGATTGLYGPY